jgi:Zn-dependent protease
MIYGLVTREQSGKISLAGPLTNVMLAAAFFPLTLLEGIIHEVGRLGTRINLWIALFNLIPFGPFDGRKVLAWDKGAYLVALAIAVAAFLFI